MKDREKPPLWLALTTGVFSVVIWRFIRKRVIRFEQKSKTASRTYTIFAIVITVAAIVFFLFWIAFAIVWSQR